tara:strand:- start:2431 stop:2601 length:171 start_codon:yes stop_codon:yes gene_type:complete
MCVELKVASKNASISTSTDPHSDMHSVKQGDIKEMHVLVGKHNGIKGPAVLLDQWA